LLSKPLFLGGDFNTSQFFPALAELGLSDTRNDAPIKTNVRGTFTNWKVHGLPLEQAAGMGSLIDFISHNKREMNTTQYAILQRAVLKDGKKVEEIMSDHRPVFVDIQL